MTSTGPTTPTTPTTITSVPTVNFDIEHVLVEDDPRKWSNFRKYMITFVISSASLIAGLSCNIYNPAIAQVRSQLHSTSQEISLSLSLFILVQGNFPYIWTSISEIKGRKWVYLASSALTVVGCIVTARASSIGVLIGMRCISAAGSSSVMSLGAATLADLFDPAERGTVMGVYYIAPLLGPSLGSIVGGALAQAWGWRADFWFLAIWCGACFLSFIFIKDTFRKERSLTYQAVLRRIRKEQAAAAAATGKNLVAASEFNSSEKDNVPEGRDADIEGQLATGVTPPLKDVKITVMDVNPFTPIKNIFRRPNNVLTLIPSGLFFAFTYCIGYTCSLTMSSKYGYNSLKIGLVLLSYGIGGIVGSIIGGRYSDYVLAKLKEKNGGIGYPEMRLQSTKLAMLCFPPASIAYGWLCEKHIHIAAVCVSLFAIGFFSVVVYSSTLTYIVDANNGRSSAAVATNSSLRGTSAFIATEVAVSVQNGIGDGGMYTLWAGVVVVAELMILLVAWKGKKWREAAEKSEEA